jgi:hypothetical protein
MPTSCDQIGLSSSTLSRMRLPTLLWTPHSQIPSGSGSSFANYSVHHTKVTTASPQIVVEVQGCSNILKGAATGAKGAPEDFRRGP